MQNVVLSILKVSEHDSQPELEHELLPQYVIDTGEHDGNVCFFRNDILQYETAICNMSSADSRIVYPRGWGNSCYLINFATISLVVLLTIPYFLQKNNIRLNIYMLLLLCLNQIHFLRRHQ